MITTPGVEGDYSERTPPGGVSILGSRLRVLFVDDEPRLLQGLRRMLHPMRGVWDMRFMDNAPAALEELARQAADVVVSDMGMPVMNGAQFLTAVMKRWPATIRIILSGHAELELVQRTVGPTHQFLQKPCDAEALKALVSRAECLRASLANDQLRELVGSQQSLPSLPSLYLELLELMNADEIDLRQVGELVGRDLGMSTRVLQLVNSAFFGCRRTVAKPLDAVTLLGLEILQALVLSTRAFDQIDGQLPPGFNAERLWQHSAQVSLMARQIAHSLHLSPMQEEEATVAGMLHDIGHLLLATRQPKRMMEVRRRMQIDQLSENQAERLELGSTHGELGAYLLGLWGISDPIVEAVAWHHEPRHHQGRKPVPLTCVHLADTIIHFQEGAAAVNPLCMQHLAQVGVPGDLNGWMSLADLKAGGGS